MQFMSFKKGVPLGVPSATEASSLSPSAAASIGSSPTAAAAVGQGAKMVEKQLKRLPSSAQLLGNYDQ